MPHVSVNEDRQTTSNLERWRTVNLRFLGALIAQCLLPWVAEVQGQTWDMGLSWAGHPSPLSLSAQQEFTGLYQNRPQFPYTVCTVSIAYVYPYEGSAWK